ncbi:MAG: JAB domain-containing protein [Oscillospiraceae bacterium]
MGKNNVRAASGENVHKGHRKRVRERFIQTGFYGFNEHQIMEMLLFYCVPRRDTNVLAHRLIDRFGSLSAVLDAGIGELKEFGLSENAAVLFRMIPAATDLYFSTSPADMIYDSPEKVMKLFRSLFSNDRFEIYVACFRNDMSLITTKLIYAGERHPADVSRMTQKEYYEFSSRPEFEGFPVDKYCFRNIAEAVISCGSSNVVTAHNHLFSGPMPYDDEIETIRKLRNILSALEINLADHIIVGDATEMPLRNNDLYDIFSCEDRPVTDNFFEL